jgi:hypothetical protein
MGGVFSKHFKSIARFHLRDLGRRAGVEKTFVFCTPNLLPTGVVVNLGLVDVLTGGGEAMMWCASGVNGWGVRLCGVGTRRTGCWQ